MAVNPWDLPGVAREIDAYWTASEGEWREILGRDMLAQLGMIASVLDVGCGSGQIYGEMLKRGITDSYHYLGLDISEEMLRLARRNYLATGFQACAEGGRLPVGDRSWENVICIHVVQHMADYGRLLAELTRVTKHNLYIVTWLAEREEFRNDGKFYQNVYAMRGFVDSVLGARGGIHELRLAQIDGQSYSMTVRYQ